MKNQEKTELATTYDLDSQNDSAINETQADTNAVKSYQTLA